MNKNPFEFGFVQKLKNFFRADDLDDLCDDSASVRAATDFEFVANTSNPPMDRAEASAAALIVLMKHFDMPSIVLHRDSVANTGLKNISVERDGEMVKFKITEVQA